MLFVCLSFFLQFLSQNDSRKYSETEDLLEPHLLRLLVAVDEFVVTHNQPAVCIGRLRLGSQVFTENPLPEGYDFSFPEPEQQFTWRKISLSVERK